MNGSDKMAALAKISTINAVEGFDPAPLAVDYIDMNTGETRTRLPVMAQMAWFRLKYPEGKFTLNVAAGKDCFIAAARVYAHYIDPVDNYLSEATASRAALPSKPSVSAREWAQTAALGIALRNAGFGLQFNTAGEGFDEVAVNELKQPLMFNLEPDNDLAAPPATALPSMTTPAVTLQSTTSQAATLPSTVLPAATLSPATLPAATPPDPVSPAAMLPAAAPAVEDPLEAAMKMPCPVNKFKGKTLGDVVSLDPGAIVWIAQKYSKDAKISEAAKLICEHASLYAADQK